MAFPLAVLTFCDRVRRLCGQLCFWWRWARRAAGADRNRRSLRHVAAPDLLGVSFVPQMLGLCAPGLAICGVGADQGGTPPAVLLGHRRHSCTGRVILAAGAKNPALLPITPPDWRIVVFFWRCWSFTFALPVCPQIVLDRLMRRLTKGRPLAGGEEARPPYDLLDTIQSNGLRSLGYGERLLPRSDFPLCDQFT